MNPEAALFTGAVVAFLPFSPLTIDVVNLSRPQQIWLYQRRHAIWAVGTACTVGLLGLDVMSAAGPGHWTVAVALGAAALGLMYWTGYVPIVMSPPREARRLEPGDADAQLAADTVVLGLAQGRDACAYLRDEIARPHYFVDRIGDAPVIVSYCILCNSATAFRASLDGRALELRCVTAYNNNIIYRDVARGNYIQQLDGRVIAGPDAGRSLEMIPVVLTTWKSWSQLHPRTLLFRSPPRGLRDRRVDAMLRWMIPLPKLASRSRPWHRIRGVLDLRRPPMSFVLGVEVGITQRAYPLNAVIHHGVVNDVLDGEPLVILTDAGSQMAQVFSRRLDGRVLTFEYSEPEGLLGRAVIDTQTGTRWSPAGVALSGSLATRQLKPIPHFNKLFWFSWAMFKPETDLWSPAQQPSTTGHDPETSVITTGGER